MKIVLKENVRGLGSIGSVVTVKPGYAWNFLIPKLKAVVATPKAVNDIEMKRSELEQIDVQNMKNAELISSKLLGVHFVIPRDLNNSGKLYSSVSAKDLASCIKSETGIDVPTDTISIPSGIKEYGVFTASLHLHYRVTINILFAVSQNSESGSIAIKSHTNAAQ